ncbi:MAG TPA: 50S ribosomal protein L9 [Acidimicrobiales bacterium]|jgi:large subunit ribosomal protein L9|nr:50S ribosomal protein L9 [Acidimicrobiales bacterium]
MVTLILRSDVDNVGKKGDVVDVADGFARNFLVAKGLAMKATPGAIAQASGMRRARAVKDARDRESAEQVARILVTKVIRIAGRAGSEGRLFGSVTSADLVAAVQEQAGVTLERRRVHLDEPIKTLGTHEVPVRLHPEVEFRLPVEVVAGGK